MYFSMILEVVEERCDWWVLAKGVVSAGAWSVDVICAWICGWSVQCVVIALVSCRGLE